MGHNHKQAPYPTPKRLDEVRPVQSRPIHISRLFLR